MRISFCRSVFWFAQQSMKDVPFVQNSSKKQYCSLHASCCGTLADNSCQRPEMENPVKKNGKFRQASEYKPRAALAFW